MFLEKNGILFHESWEEFVVKNLDLIESILRQVDKDSTLPERDKILKCLETNVNNVKICISGMDAYPTRGVSTGKSFQVGNVKSWNQKFRQTSLRNILRLLYKTKNKISNYEEIPKFLSIVKEIEDGVFKIQDPFNLFESWWNQGVLLYNVSLTVEEGKPGSHSEIWMPFSKALYQYLGEKNPNIYYFLWGKDAQSFEPFITSNNIIKSRHPMMCSVKYDDDFLKSDCFLKTADMIEWY